MDDQPTGVQRLFLGGPLHGRRLIVDESSYNYVALAPIAPVFTIEPEYIDFNEGRIMYSLRRTPGGRDRVFIAPDYGYDTPEWLAYDTEAWVTQVRPDHAGWEHLDRHWLWRGQQPDFKLKRLWTYILGDGRGERYVAVTVTDEVAHEAGQWVRDELRHELDHHLTPLCVVGECVDKGLSVFIAAEDGRLAGRAWRKGDEIRLCPKHAHDVYLAQGVFGIDQLAEWLRPDAQPRRDDGLYSAASAALYGEDSVTRMIRLGQKAEGR